jgi:glycosyltransferase involved in cell wall biosynthesis
MTKTRLLVEGWRGINHSYAMVNQFQLLELLKVPTLEIKHRDVDFNGRDWNRVKNTAGFPQHLQDQIDAIPGPSEDEAFDVVYRIAWPFQPTQTKCRRAITFLTAEYGLGPEHFPTSGADIAGMVAGDNLVVTPSSWSKMKLLEAGFPEQKIVVIPHGYHPDIYYPLSPEERQGARSALGIEPDAFVVLNLGAMIHNKGIDILIRGFAEFRKSCEKAVLVLKDDKNLYGIGAQGVVAQILSQYPECNSFEVVSSIKLLSATLPLTEMRKLYGLADVYASPYRAEGFNLPVLEAMACGTRVIVTKGGATDDFVSPDGVKIESTLRPCNEYGIRSDGFILEPSTESLWRKLSDAFVESTSHNNPSRTHQTWGHAMLKRLESIL